MRVLYVDDDPAMTAAVKQMLASEGYDCDSVDLGKRAVELATRNDYDIILLDIMMPDIDGYEVVERLRENRVRTPVLVQSGLVDRENEMDGLWLGTSEYLIKPFNRDELIGRIQAVLSQSADAQASDPVYAPDTGAPAEDGGAQRRRHRRFDTVQPGRILHGHGIDCVIMDMSYGGAAIQLPSADTDCPETFDLRLESGSTLRCQLRWRDGDRIGVQGETLWPEEVVAGVLNQAGAGIATPDTAVPETSCQAAAAAQVDEDLQTALSPQREEQAQATPPVQEHPAPAAPPSPSPPEQVRQAPPQTRDPAGVPQAAEDIAEAPQVFTVDRGIRLVAETCECTQLAIEGYLEATARAESLLVGPEGRFLGAAEVVNAEVHGHVEGELTVTGTLVIHSTGRVSGTTRYRQVAIEGGGRIMGEVRILSQGPVAVPGDREDLGRAAPAA